MKKANVVIILVAFIGLFAVAGFAQQAPKIAVINSSRAFEQSVEGKRVATQLQERDQKTKAEIQRQEDALRTLENKLNTGRLTMTQDALLALQADIDKKTTERKRFGEDSEREFNQYQAGLVQRIRQEMVAVVIALRKEKGYEIVLDLGGSGIVDYDTALDITDEVVKRYDATKAPAAPVKK